MINSLFMGWVRGEGRIESRKTRSKIKEKEAQGERPKDNTGEF
jgi:hypothetical protein